MNPRVLPHNAPPGDGVPLIGELVVLNGRQSGARRPLTVPVMFVGRTQGCDVRLNVEGIEPFHCVLASRPGEVTVRDLNSAQGTFVNGQRISAALLRDGDLLDVGPFRFRLLLPTTPPVARAAAERPQAHHEAHHEAVRTQAAAVAAQQAALDEQETRLQQQANHLTAEVALLLAEREAAQRERADFERWTQERRDELECQREELRSELERERQVADEEIQQQRDHAAAELQRVQQEIGAARQCIDTEGQTARGHLAAEERRLARQSATLDQVKSELQYQESDLAVQQVRLNTQREVDTRLLQDGWQTLAKDQQRWRQRRSRESLALRVRHILLTEAERKLADIRTQILHEREAWAAQRQGLESELQGLNTRIVHQRQIVQEHEALRAAVAPTPTDASPEAPHAARAADLDRLTGELADQRALLMEQWERLTRMQDAWQARRDEAAEALDIVGRQLAEQEASLTRRAQQVEEAEARQTQRQEQLDRSRRHAALVLARSEAQRQAWEAERDEVQAAAARQSEQAQRQLAALAGLRRKWSLRRQQERAPLLREQQKLDQQRVELNQARGQIEEQARLLEDARRTLAEEARLLHDAATDPRDPGGNEAQGEPLRKRWMAQNAALVRALHKQRAGLKSELEKLRARGDELAARAEQLTRAQAQAHELESALEHREALVAAAQAALAEQRRQVASERAQSERRLAILQEESEHLARALIPDTEAPPEALERAA
jgi:pSer/pThr/pTyr-binding forkhead associated (FHA) protein